MIKVIIADDHRMFREALTKILTLEQIAEVIGEASNGNELLTLLDTHTPDIILMDIAMPEMDGIEAARRAIKKQPAAKILTLSGYDDDRYYFSMVDAGAKGFVLKNAGIIELQNALNELMQGGNWFSSQLLQNVIQKLNTRSQKSDKPELSEREKEILGLVCESFTNEEIAGKLHISNDTVKWHRANILSKTGCTNAAGLVIYAIKNKLIEI